MFYDDAGMILATSEVETRPPWEVRKSKKFRGRYYFYNSETTETMWSLPPSVLSLEPRSSGGQGVRPSPSLPGIASSFGIASGGGGSKRPLFLAPSASFDSRPAPSPLGTSMDGAPLDAKMRSKRLAMFTTGQTFDSGSSNEVLSPGASIDGSRSVEETTTTSTDVTDYIITGGLGQGGYACVVKAENTKTGKEYALKVLSKRACPNNKDRRRLKRELMIMSELPSCPHLMRCHTAFETANDVFFVLDLLTGGDLFYHLALVQESNPSASVTGFPENQARIMLSEVVLALKHLHEHGFVHRDVKVENIMLDAQGHIKLIDFGLAVEIKDKEGPMSPMGSLIYMPPELLSERVGGRHTDWWSVGILAYEMMTGRSPWTSLSDKKLVRHEIKTVRVLPPRRLSSAAGHLIASLLNHDRVKRLGSGCDDEVLAAPFFESIDWEATAIQQNEPAFVPEGSNTFKRDRNDAIAAYRDRCKANNEPSPWKLGVVNAKEFPEIVH